MSIFPYLKTCLYCGVQFQGRRNAKFCLPTHKALYHAQQNRNKKDSEQQRFKPIIDILVRNCEIIDQLKQEEYMVVSKDELLSRGFKFNYITHMSQRGEHNTIRWFDNGFKILGNDEYELLK